MALVNSNRWVWLAGFVLSRVSLSMGSCRTTYIIRTTAEEQRTRSLALQPISALVGAFVGPLLTILCSLAPSVEAGGITFDPSTATFWVSSLLNLCRLPLLLWGFSEERFTDLRASAPSQEDRRADRRAWGWLALLGACVFLFQLTNNAYTLTFYPILINFWGFSQTRVSYVVLSVVLLSILPPLCIAFLSKRWGISDRTFLLAGLLGCILPITVFAYPTGRLWSVLLGGCFAVVCGTVVGPTTNALFSKKVGTHNASAFKVGLLTSIQSLGSALGALLGDVALKAYQTYTFLAWSAPLLATALLVITSWPHLRIAPKIDLVSSSDLSSNLSSNLSSELSSPDRASEREPLFSSQLHSRSSIINE